MYFYLAGAAFRREKWKVTHREHINAYNRGYRHKNEAYRIKQLGYVRAHRARKRCALEFERLRSIDLF